MKKIFTIVALAAVVACNDTSTGGEKSDSSNKGSSDSISEPPVPSQQTDTTLPAMGDSARQMIDTASSKVKMMTDTASKMRSKM